MARPEGCGVGVVRGPEWCGVGKGPSHRDGSEEGLARESGLGELAEDDAVEVVPEAVEAYRPRPCLSDRRPPFAASSGEAFALARSSQLRVEEREVLVFHGRGYTRHLPERS